MTINHQYRPDIDGLRAFAVLSVVFYHLFPNVLQGGFIGVDIFFVISGYLISRIILKKLDDGTFSFADFYARRIKRIFPVLLIILIGVFVYSFFVLIPYEFHTISKHVSAASIFISNIRLASEDAYFDVSSNAKPLLHLWSLAVEEQFYIFWPLSLFAIHRIFKKIDAKLFFMVIATFISYLCFIYLHSIYSDKAFYYLLPRIWELSVGAIVAVFSIKAETQIDVGVSKNIHNILSFACMVCILLSVIFFKEDMKYFQFLALIPVLSAGYIIYTSNQNNITSRFLAHPILVHIGLISYPLYLFHWPIISFIYIVDEKILTTPVKFFIFFISLFLSWISYKYFEAPIRHSKNKYTPIILLIMMSVISMASFYAYRMESLSYPAMKYPIAIKISDAGKDYVFPTRSMKSFAFNQQTYYHLGDLDKDIVVFFGDSNMEQYASRLDYLYKNGNYKLTSVFATKKGLCPIPGVEKLGSGKHADFTNDFYSYAMNKNVKRVVISASWLIYFVHKKCYYYTDGNVNKSLNPSENHDFIFMQYENMLKKIIDAGKEVYLILTMPQGAQCEPKFLASRTLMGHYVENYQYANKEIWDAQHQDIKKRMIDIARLVGAKIIDPNKHFELNGQYKNYDENFDAIYIDQTHLRASYVEKNADFLDILVQ